MNHHNGLVRATHYALSLEPATASPGSAIRLCYRAYNASVRTSPAARVRFVLPSDATVAPDESLELALPPLAPGTSHDAVCNVVLASPLDDGTRLAFQALVDAGDGDVLGSNVATLRVRSRALLDGPRTYATLARADEPDVVVIGATVANDGDGPACDIAVHLPAPYGTEPLDDAPVTFHLPRIDAGASVDVAYRARIAAPAGDALALTDAWIADAAGPLFALAAPPALPLAGRLGRPELRLTAAGRRIDVACTIANAGAGPAEDVHITFRWPRGFRCADGSPQVDGIATARPRTRGAYATAVLRPDAVEIAVAAIPARTAAVVDLTLHAVAGAAGGELTCETHAGAERSSVAAPLPWEPRAEVVFSAPADAAGAPGTCATVRVDAVNRGDLACTLQVVRAGESAGSGERIALGAGCARNVGVPIPLPDDAFDGARCEVTLEARDGAGALVARTRVAAVVRDRAWIDTRAWLVDDGDEAAIVLTNRGALPARAIVLHFDSGRAPLACGSIPPGATRRFPIVPADLDTIVAGGRVESHGRTVARLAPAAERPRAARIEARFDVPGSVAPGITSTAALTLRTGTHVAALCIRLDSGTGACIVAGSLTVNGHAVADHAGVPALAAERGLRLHELAPDTRVEIGWQFVIDPAVPAEQIALAARVTADELTTTVVSSAMTVDTPPPFGARPSSLPFHVEGLAVRCDDASAPDSTPPDLAVPEFAGTAFELPVPTSQSHAVRLTLHLDAERTERIARILRGAAMPGFVSHIFSLRALYPDAAWSADPGVTHALAVHRDAVRAVLDRLYVKMRIPGFDVSADECEDVPARRTLVSLMHALSAGDCVDDLAAGDVAFAAIATETAERYAQVLDDEPIGGAAALRAIAALLPDDATDVRIAAPLRAYVARLRAMLDDACDESPAAFDHRLATGDDRLLDALRADVIDALTAWSPAVYA